MFLLQRTGTHLVYHQASAAVRIVVADGLHEADVAFLNEVRIGQAVSEKASGDRDEYLIIIGNGIAMIGSFFHVIFLYGVQPDCRNSQVGEIIQMESQM